MLSNTTQFRRITAGLCLILAPLSLLIGIVLETRGFSTLQEMLDAIAKQQAVNEVAYALAVYGFALMIPAVIGIIHLLRHRAVALGHIGGTLAILGLVSFAFIAGTEFLMVIGSDPTLNRDAVIALNDRVGSSIVYNIINLTEVFGVFLGFIILAIAIFRANVVHRIFPILLATGIFLRFALAGLYAGVILSKLLQFIALAAIGLTVLRQTDDEWARPPERDSARASSLK